MPQLIELNPLPPKSRFAIVVAEWNRNITDKLLAGAVETLTAAGVADENIDIAWVPGSWEIPVAVQRMADTCRYAAIIALGAVIKGETAHDRAINDGVTHGLMRIAIEHSLPVMLGVLMCDTLEQAIHRAGGNVGNKGVECAEAALKMARLLPALPTH